MATAEQSRNCGFLPVMRRKVSALKVSGFVKVEKCEAVLRPFDRGY